MGISSDSDKAEDEQAGAFTQSAGRDRGLEGADAELQEYAKSLGVDVKKDVDLEWIVQEAFAANLPPSWTEHMDEEGRIYFFNQVTQESSWLHPMDTVFKEVIQLIKALRHECGAEPLAGGADASAARIAEAVQEHLESVHRRALKHIDGWSGPYASEAGQYYYSAVSGVSSWESPIDEWQNQLALRQRILHRCLLQDSTCSTSGDPRQHRNVLDGGTGVPWREVQEVFTEPFIELPRLPLGLAVPSFGTSEAGPKTPSSTRSFATARSGRSARSARSARSPTPTRSRATPTAVAAAGWRAGSTSSCFPACIEVAAIENPRYDGPDARGNDGGKCGAAEEDFDSNVCASSVMGQRNKVSVSHVDESRNVGRTPSKTLPPAAS